MNLFQTFLDALKINWKQKPMWKLTLLAYVPLSFVFSILLVPLIIAAGYFYNDTGTLLDNLGSISFLLLFVVSLIIISLISVACLLISQVGSSIMMQQTLANLEGVLGNNKLSAPFLKKIRSGFLYYLIVIGIPRLVIYIGLFGSFALMSCYFAAMMIYYFFYIFAFVFVLLAISLFETSILAAGLLVFIAISIFSIVLAVFYTLYFSFINFKQSAFTYLFCHLNGLFSPKSANPFMKTTNP